MIPHLTAKSRRRCVGVNLQKLGTSNWWLSSPNNYNGSNAFEWNVNYSSGNLLNSGVDNSRAFRPSINLKAELLVGGGDGTSSNPYTVNVS